LVIAHTFPFITGPRAGQKLCPLPRPARQFVTPFAVISCQNGIHKTDSSAQSPIFGKLSPFISPDNVSIKSTRHLLWIGVGPYDWVSAVGVCYRPSTHCIPNIPCCAKLFCTYQSCKFSRSQRILLVKDGGSFWNEYLSNLASLKRFSTYKLRKKL